MLSRPFNLYTAIKWLDYISHWPQAHNIQVTTFAAGIIYC